MEKKIRCMLYLFILKNSAMHVIFYLLACTRQFFISFITRSHFSRFFYASKFFFPHLCSFLRR